jgi:hypothetical protein
MSSLLPPGSWLGSNHEYIFDNCPFCDKEKHFYWNVDRNMGQCKVCGNVLLGLNALTDLALGDSVIRPAEAQARRREVRGVEVMAWLDFPTQRYLLSKGVSRLQCKRFGIVVDVARGRLRIPVDPLSPEFPAADLVRHYKFRESKWIPEKGTNKMNYGWNLGVLRRKAVLVCEGIYDVLSTQMEDYGLAVLGSDFNSSFFTAFQNHTLFMWLDWDEAGWKGAAKLKKAARIYGFTVIDVCARVRVQCEPKKKNPNLSLSNRTFIQELKEEMDSYEV